MENNSPSASKTDRKTVEKNTRNQMKALYSTLNSLVPHHRSGDPTSLPDQLDEAASYIKKLQTNLEKMKERKDILMGIYRPPNTSIRTGTTMGWRPVQIDIHQAGSALEVVLTTGLDWQFMFNETLRVLHEEGADIVNASFSVVDDAIFHIIHSQVSDSGHSNVVGRISERLKQFVQDASVI